ncbi:MAG: helix-turn-helix domain-containing protein, partial [Candidatus Thermoplasmatota archaeon]|nr:helix-turn-helix domain-containing protein [Candidatus Thermoplasmatota archaeon]
MAKKLTNNEKKVLYGLVRHPRLTDTELAEKLELAQSTVTTIRHRLQKIGAVKEIWLPMVNRIGCELLVLIHTNFNPVVPVEERAEKTRKTIEIFEEIFFSIGEAQKGFSLSMSENYTKVGEINDIRTKTFASMDLLEKEYPAEAIFPFEISTIHRFFNFAPFLERQFGLGDGWGPAGDITFEQKPGELSETDKRVYAALVEKPEKKDGEIARDMGISRHTVALHRKKLEDEGHIKRLRIPDMKEIGVNLLVFHHVKFNLHKE